MKKFTTSLFLIAVFLIVSGCVAQKKKDDVGPVGKGYHNMTAHYNGYYNATVLVAESKLELESQYKDNYRKILPIYKYVAADNPKAVADALDKAVEKVSVVVNLHRVSRWTDDCYLLLGQAQYTKQDYESAEESLEFMTGEFNPKEVAKRESKSKSAKKRKKTAVKQGKTTDENGEKVELSKKEKEKLAKKKRQEREKERKRKMKEAKKRKKGKGSPSKKPGDETNKKNEKKNDTQKVTEKEGEEPKEEALPAPGSITLGNLETNVVQSDPESYFMKHRPAYQEGLLWLARTYIERENFTNAERLLNELERSPGTFEDVRREAAVAKAHFFLKQKKYDQAVEPLQAAIDLSNDHQMKARLNFILGQIHQQAKREDAAFAAFNEVLENQPTYDMEFSARLNLALSNASKEESKQQLDRMLKEEKNKEFQDQIYYAIAAIALENGDKKEGIKNLELSLQKSSANISQKAESYLLLADLYFEDESFVKAKLYYDSTLLVMTDADERYRRVSNLATNLDGIAQNLKLIETQDSLLAISRMTEDERAALAAKIKKQQDEERIRQAKEKALAGAKSPNLPKGAPAAPPALNTSKFWAYHDRDRKDGKRDFERKWGSRQLQDNWRRADQSSSSNADNEIVEATENRTLTPEEINTILKDVPDSPEKIGAANRQIEAAFFALGTLFRDRIQNYKQAVQALEELLKRYPDTQYKLDALYYLYLSYKDMGDEANAQVYFDRIVNGYPTSNYARILIDPTFVQQVKAKEDKLTIYYDETLSNFEQRQYQAAFDRIAKVGEMFGGQNKLMPRFALLGAMCIGNLQGKEAYVEALKEVIAKYPEDPESTRSKEILRLLGENIGSGPGQQRDLPPGEGQVGSYQVTDDQLHYVIVVFKNDVVLNDAKVLITDYNEKYHKLQKLRMNNIFLGDGDSKFPIIAIRRYKDKAESMDYLNTIKKNKQDFLDEGKYQFEVFPISQDNYRELLKSKNLDDYRTFFEKNYLK
ncbi:MAG: tetratricopeptide repeat protein [Bacteroidetes bacterium]|nr:tetratricopeptide repeat protein [Bacteroidota bacterium]